MSIMKFFNALQIPMGRVEPGLALFSRYNLDLHLLKRQNTVLIFIFNVLNNQRAYHYTGFPRHMHNCITVLHSAKEIVMISKGMVLQNMVQCTVRGNKHAQIPFVNVYYRRYQIIPNIFDSVINSTCHTVNYYKKPGLFKEQNTGFSAQIYSVLKSHVISHGKIISVN